MGLLDELGGLLGQPQGQAQSSGIIGALLQAGGSSGGLGGMLETLCANGLADHVASWAGNGQNLPVSPDQIRAALGSEQVQQMAQSAGLPVQEFLQHLTDHLPAAAATAS